MGTRTGHREDMTRWSDDDVSLLMRWVGMVAPLICDGEPDAAILAALDWQVRLDLAERDYPHIGGLIDGGSAAMHQAAVEIRQAMRCGLCCSPAWSRQHNGTVSRRVSFENSL